MAATTADECHSGLLLEAGYYPEVGEYSDFILSNVSDSTTIRGVVKLRFARIRKPSPYMCYVSLALSMASLTKAKATLTFHVL